MSLNNLADGATLIPLLPTAAYTETTAGTGVDISAYTGKLLVALDSAAGTGTDPTMDVTIKECATIDGSYTAITGAAFTQVVDAAGAEKIGVLVDPRKKYIQAVATIGGTTPSFTCSVNAFGAKQYA